MTTTSSAPTTVDPQAIARLPRADLDQRFRQILETLDHRCAMFEFAAVDPLLHLPARFGEAPRPFGVSAHKSERSPT